MRFKVVGDRVGRGDSVPSVVCEMWWTRSERSGERVVIWWFGGGGGAACGNGGVMRGVKMVSVLAGILVAIRGDVSRVGGDVGGVNLAEGVRESSAKVMCRRVGCESLCGRDDAWVVGVL
jgi:hypothetical protein